MNRSERLQMLDPGACDRNQILAAMVDIRAEKGWLASLHGACTRRLRELDVPYIESNIAATGRTTARDAEAVLRRADVLGQLPAFDQAMIEGHVSVAHADALARVATPLPDQERELLLADPLLIGIASQSTPERFARHLRAKAALLSADDGIGLFERQRRMTHLRTWVDPDSGMVVIHGAFDPENGARLIGRLDRAVEAMFHSATPDTCPTGPGKNDHLRALALLGLTSSAGPLAAGPVAAGPVATGAVVAGPAPAEIVVVVDYETLRNGVHEHSRMETSGGVELPVESLRRLACNAAIIPAVLGSDGVVLDLGRATRLASREQRRALRVMHPRCSMPGCPVAFDRCEPHHIAYWRHGGRTDLANLVPLCSKHHHRVHEGGWQLSLDPVTRNLTVTLPDGTVQSTGPPSARAG